MDDKKFAEEIEEILRYNQVQKERLNARLDLQLISCSAQRRSAEYAFSVKEWSLNPYGGVHGGVICSLFDTSMGVGAVALSQKMVSTADLSVSYLRPMNGKRYLFYIEYTHLGKRLIRCTGKAVDEESGLVCATAMASFVATESAKKGLQV